MKLNCDRTPSASSGIRLYISCHALDAMQKDERNAKKPSFWANYRRQVRSQLTLSGISDVIAFAVSFALTIGVMRIDCRDALLALILYGLFYIPVWILVSAPLRFLSGFIKGLRE